jgi:serine/threonine-protein kinase
MPRRILRLKVWGFWDVPEAKDYLEEFLAKASRLVGGPWYVLADIADFTAQKPEVNPYLGKAMEFAASHGMRRAANLVNSALSKMQIARLSKDMGLPEFSFFTSEDEAVAWLLRG